MTTITLRPNATNYQGAWTVTSAASAHAAVNDNSDASYISASTSGWLCVFDLDVLTLPAYAQIRAVQVRVRRLGNSSARFDVSIGYQPASGSYQSVVLSSGEKPTSTIATKTYGSLVSAPGGTSWDNSYIIPNLQIAVAASSSSIRVHEIYVDVVYDEAPTCVITAPVGTISGSQIPDIQFVFTDPDSSTLERAQAKIFTEAQYDTLGFNVETSDAFWSSGTVLTSQPSIRIGTPLPSGDYYVYVRASDSGSGGRYGPWEAAEFSMGGDLPATPTIVVSTDSVNRRNVVVVTQQDNYLAYGQASVVGDDDEGDGWYADYGTTLDQLGNGTDAPSVTTLNETFTGANGALAAGNTDINWTVVAGSFAVNSNQLTSSNTELILPPTIRADTALPSSNMYAQISVVTLSTSADRSAHVYLRADASAYTGYVVEINQDNNRYAIWRAAAGVGHAVSGFRPLPGPLSLPATWRGEVRGNKISAWLNGVKLGEFTDSNITTGTRVGCGMYNANSISRIDTFQAGDLDPVVPDTSTSITSDSWLLQMTITGALNVGRAHSGGPHGWACPVTAAEQITVTASCWQSANVARSFWVDVEYFNSSGLPNANNVFTEDFTGTNGASWDSDWTDGHGAGATDTIQSNQGVLTTGTSAYSTPAREHCSGMSAIANAEVYVKAIPGSLSAESRGIIGLRGDGTWNVGHPAQGYYVELDPQNAKYYVRVAGADTVIGNINHTWPAAAATGVYVRLRIFGAVILARVWNADETEPADWGYNGLDFTWGSAGYASLISQNGADAVARTWTFDDFAIDDLSTSQASGVASTTSTSSLMTEWTANLTVPAGATSAVLALNAYSTGASEIFYWNKIGIMPGHSKDWSRGGLLVENFVGPNAGTFEESAGGVAGWTAGTSAAVARTAYISPASKAALALDWAGSSGIPSYVQAIGPGFTAEAGKDYVVKAWLRRASSSVTLLRVGLRFSDGTGNALTEGLSADVLPTAKLWADGTFTMQAPTNTATVHPIFVSSTIVDDFGSATRFDIREGTAITNTYRPGPAAKGFALVEYSDDSGETWYEVRGTEEAYYVNRVVTVYDYEAPQGVARLYRASTAAVDYAVDATGGATVSSVPSASDDATLPVSGWWLKDPLDPGVQMELNVRTPLELVSQEPQERYDPLGREYPVIRSDVVKSEELALKLIFHDQATYDYFETLRRLGSTLLFQTDMGDNYYVKLGNQRRTILEERPGRIVDPIRWVEINAAEVERP